MAERPAAARGGRAGRRRRSVGLVLEQDLGSLVQLLALHAPVLEPDLDLTLAEMQFARDLPPLLARNVRVSDEFVFKHHCLIARIRLPLFALSRQLYNTADSCIQSTKPNNNNNNNNNINSNNRYIYRASYMPT